MIIGQREHSPLSGCQPDRLSVLAMVYKAAHRQGSKTAVTCGDQFLTYNELIAAARANAKRLHACGVSNKDIVLCALPTGVELPIAWLSVMMTNAIIIPVDAKWPENRIHAVVEASQAAWVITNGEQPALRSAGLNLFEIRLDGTTDLNAETHAQCFSDDLLYGFFTSGSTGRPKCALNYHAGLVNRFTYMTKRFGGGHTVYQNSAPLFDSSIWQMLWPLTNGGVAVLPKQRDHWNVESLVEEIERHHITMTDFVPTLFKLLTRALENGTLAAKRLDSLRHVLIGGEEIDAASVHTFRRFFPRCTVINTYGHTEASIGMVFHEVCDHDNDKIPLGQPIDNTYVKIVDDQLRPVTDGVFGEIVVAGICVGGGYLNAPELSARSFIRNPFSDLPGDKVYLTGDIGRIRPDGCLEYGGRADDQVKVRGVRIELNEIVSAIKAGFDAVNDALAFVLPTQQGDASLALVYVAPHALDLQHVRRELARHLPATHMPQLVHHLKTLPISPNGKVDRKRIINDLKNDHSETLQPCSNSTLLEKIIACYRTVLLNNQIGSEDDFFECGGDSLAAANLSLALCKHLGTDVPMTAIYQFATPSQLADFMSGCEQTVEATPSDSLARVAFNNHQPTATMSSTLLLTGSSGFVGIHILAHLLATTHLHVTVLLRGSNRESALCRLEKVFLSAFPARVLQRQRITVVLGDLALPCWGLDPDEWQHQCASIDEVIHCGAAVNFLFHASQLFSANVGGTQELIRFCNEGKAKRLHHISSLAAKLPAVSGRDPEGSVSAIEAAALGVTGYGYTKYLADNLVVAAQQQGLHARIYRVDDVLPSMSTGYSNGQSLFHLLLKQCVQMGVAPAGCGSLGLLSADALAEWLCTFVGSQERFQSGAPLIDVVGQHYVEFDDIVRYTAQRTGRDIACASYTEFLSMLTHAGQSEATLIQQILPPVNADKVAFTKVRRCLPADIPQAHLLTADLNSFDAFIHLFKAELDERSNNHCCVLS
ncbi:amino acid adenylation domain-containing protein [Pseudomonas fluorescens]|uniref:amino acid adenylation domain-containing protein n=1 Tax=Pseudomonas fluorescens TaxID=294 RepID=UPI0014726C48|nr:amino acid adenylation domain-containing protein [Pseudomonas fluorescens]NNB68548.1 amino acid adenylation domain-containing protein [Pseudomonas fluorescens]